MKKSILIIIIALLLLATAIISSCNTDPSVGEVSDSLTDETTEQLLEEVNIEFTVEGKSEYVIIYPEGSDAGVKDLALSLRSSIEKYTGAQLSVRSDRLLEQPIAGNGIEVEKEILLGATNREASQKVIADFKSRDYAVVTDGEKIVLAGITIDSIDRAIERFISNVLLKQCAENRGHATVVMTAEHHFTYHYSGYVLDSCTLPGGDLSNYYIVYNKNDSYSAERTARLFKQWLSNKAGYVVELQTELAAGKDEAGALPEIVFGNTNRGGTPVTTRHGYSVTASGNKLFVTAECVEGYSAALTYLTETLFANGDVEIKDGFTYSDVAVVNKAAHIDEKLGEYRVIFNNIYGQDKAEHPIAIRLQMQAELHNEYRPDVICTQESTPHVSQYISKIKSYGYAEVPAKPTNSNNCNYTPVFYLKDKFDVIDYGYYLYDDGANDKSKSVTWAVFKDKTSGDVFAVGSTHFYYTSDELGNSARKKDAEQLSAVVKDIVAKYNCPVIVGGDLNCNPSSQPFSILFNEGFEHMFDKAEKKNDIVTHHSYPVYDTDLKMYTGKTMPTRAYSYSIDHAIMYNASNITTKLFLTLTHDYTLYSTDHCPVLVDFNVN